MITVKCRATENSLLANYEMVKTEEDHGVYEHGSQNAFPNFKQRPMLSSKGKAASADRCWICGGGL